MHYRPTISRNLIRNNRLQEWFYNEGVKYVAFDDNLGFAVTDYMFNVILTLNHNFWHLMYEGMGMRQMMDLYFVLRTKIKDEGLRINDELLRLLEYFKLIKFAAASMWVMREVFHLEDEFLLCNPDDSRGRALLDEIMQAGNFGHHDERLNDNRYKTSRISLMCAWMRHSLRLFWQYPEDVLWTPIGILRISLWRRLHYRNEIELKNK